MNNFKSYSSGMMFVEVLFAICIIGLVLSSTLLLQNSLFTKIFGFSSRADRVVLLRNRLLQEKMERTQSSEKKKSHAPKEESMGTTISYSTKRPDKNSALKNFKSIVIEQAKATWKSAMLNESESLVTILFRPEKPKS